MSVPDPFNPDFQAPEPVYTGDPVVAINAYVKRVRDKFTSLDAAQLEAYRQAETIAKRVVSGKASDADKSFLKARDVDAKTLNPMTDEPVQDVAEAAQVILMTAQMWHAVLSATEVARKTAISAVKAMSREDIPLDLEKWLSENFQWLPQKGQGS